MIKIGITGQSGFVGTHLFNSLKFISEYELVPFKDDFFEDFTKLRSFVKACDVIIHLAAMMRSPHEGEVYTTNIKLVTTLIEALNIENVNPVLFFASSIQETNGSEYARSKLDGKKILLEWCDEHHTGFGCMIFPNLFGAYARPNSHSFIATFCFKLLHNEQPQIIVDNMINLKYIKSVIKEFIPFMREVVTNRIKKELTFRPDYQITVSEVLNILRKFNDLEAKGIEVNPKTQIEHDLYETYLWYKKNLMYGL